MNRESLALRACRNAVSSARWQDRKKRKKKAGPPGASEACSCAICAAPTFGRARWPLLFLIIFWGMQGPPRSMKLP